MAFKIPKVPPTSKAPLPFDVVNIWHNLPMDSAETLLRIVYLTQSTDWQSEYCAQETVIVSPMERCELCPDGFEMD